MLDDAGNADPDFDLPDADLVYRQRLGVEPVPRERAQELIAEWSNAIAAGRSGPGDNSLADHKSSSR